MYRHIYDMMSFMKRYYDYSDIFVNEGSPAYFPKKRKRRANKQIDKRRKKR